MPDRSEANPPAPRAGDPQTHTLLVMPAAGRTSVLALMDAAQHDIALKIYTLNDDDLIDGLIRAATRGCRVRVLLNSQRGDGTRDNDQTALRLKSGHVSVAWAPPCFLATHEKSMTVDHALALIGSFNFGAKYFSETRDYGVVTRDPVQVSEIGAAFEADWFGRPFTPAGGSGLLWAPGGARHQVAALIASARKGIDLQHAKLVDATILLRLMDALKRGVTVRFLCAGGHGLHSWDRPETFASLRLLQQHGARIRRLKAPKIHGNLSIVDDRTAQLGSLHLHHAAFDSRRELAIELADKPILKVLAEQFAADWHAASHYDVPDPLLHGDTNALHNDPDPVDSVIYQI